MFTGIIETVGRVAALEDHAGGRLLRIEAGFADALAIGQSVAVSGACLTVTATHQGAFEANAVQETLRKTNLGRLVRGAPVNLERAMPANGRFEGHIVQGHVDGTCRVLEATPSQGDRLYTCDTPPELQHYVVRKGSIALDGISLTVARADPASFAVAIIPHTYAHTTAQAWQEGAVLNVECDILGKYVARYLAARIG